MDTSMAITRERSRSFVSRLQAAATSGNASVDVYRLGPCSISILANPSFSSSHQDRLWEEQADIYSSGGRGTPGRDDEPAAAAANAFVHSPSPANPVSLDDHQVPSASGSLRRGQMDATVRAPSFTSFLSSGDRGSRKKGKKRGRPRTPLRSLSAEDVHRMCCGRRSPEGGHFIQQIMLKIRGHSSRSSSPKCPNSRTKKRNTWSSCICFSANWSTSSSSLDLNPDVGIFLNSRKWMKDEAKQFIDLSRALNLGLCCIQVFGNGVGLDQCKALAPQLLDKPIFSFAFRAYLMKRHTIWRMWFVFELEFCSLGQRIHLQKEVLLWVHENSLQCVEQTSSLPEYHSFVISVMFVWTLQLLWIFTGSTKTLNWSASY